METICQLLELAPDKPQGVAHLDLIAFVAVVRADLRYAIDASKIARELGWTPADFTSVCVKTVAWYLANEPGGVRFRTEAIRASVLGCKS